MPRALIPRKRSGDRGKVKKPVDNRFREKGFRKHDTLFPRRWCRRGEFIFARRGVSERGRGIFSRARVSASHANGMQIVKPLMRPRVWCCRRKRRKGDATKEREREERGCGEANAIPPTKGCIKPRQAREGVVKARFTPLESTADRPPAPGHLRATNRIRLSMQCEYTRRAMSPDNKFSTSPD